MPLYLGNFILGGNFFIQVDGYSAGPERVDVWDPLWTCLGSANFMRGTGR